MSSKEIEAMAVGLREMVDYDVASSSADLIKYFVDEMVKRKIPAVTPPGGLAGHVDAMRFLPHVPQAGYTAGALVAALYLVSGVRGMERGTISMDRDAQGNDVLPTSNCAAWPCRGGSTASRTSTMSSIASPGSWNTATWSEGLEFYEEPPVLRFFTGKLKALKDWGTKLAAAFETDFGPNS